MPNLILLVSYFNVREISRLPLRLQRFRFLFMRTVSYWTSHSTFERENLVTLLGYSTHAVNISILHFTSMSRCIEQLIIDIFKSTVLIYLLLEKDLCLLAFIYHLLAVLSATKTVWQFRHNVLSIYEVEFINLLLMQDIRVRVPLVAIPLVLVLNSSENLSDLFLFRVLVWYSNNWHILTHLPFLSFFSYS